jgi:hypothetical protein
MPLAQTPYISPVTLTNAPTGIDWTTIPATASFDPQANSVEVWNMCARATARADEYCNQVLRATIDMELIHGPDFYMTTGPGAGGSSPTPYWGNSCASNVRIILSRWPVLTVNQVQYAASSVWPRQWATVPTGYYEPEVPPVGIYGSAAPSADAQGGQAIIVGGGYISRNLGRNGYAVMVSYTNGWPHCSLTANATAGSTTLAVDDVTGWGVTNYFGTTGAVGTIRDNGQEESVHVTAASTTAGTGTLSLASPTQAAHESGIVLTTMPKSIEQAAIYFATAEALTRGATSTVIHAISPGAESSDQSATELISEGELLIRAYKRTM